MCTPLVSNGISIYLLVVIFLPLMILVEVDTERKLPMPPPPPPPKEVEEKEVKPPPPRLPMVVMWPMWPMWPMVLMEPKEPKPEINRTKRDSHLNRWQWSATIGNVSEHVWFAVEHVLHFLFFRWCTSYLGRKVRSQHQREENRQSLRKTSHLSGCDSPDFGAAGCCRRMDHH